MNRLNVLTTILCLTLLINGCQKDSIIDSAKPENQLQSTDIDLRSYDEEICGGISELCLKCHIEVIQGPDIPIFPRLSESNGRTPQITEGIDNNYLEMIIDGETYTIRPANYFGEQTQEYLISSPKGNYITSNIQNEYVRSKALEVELPDVLQNIYKLDHKRFIEGNLNFDEVQRCFWTED